MPRKAVRYRPDIIQAMSLGAGESPLSPDDPDYPWRMLAEGDSWFSIGAISSSNLLYELSLKLGLFRWRLHHPLAVGAAASQGGRAGQGGRSAGRRVLPVCLNMHSDSAPCCGDLPETVVLRRLNTWSGALFVTGLAVIVADGAHT